MARLIFNPLIDGNFASLQEVQEQALYFGPKGYREPMESLTPMVTRTFDDVVDSDAAVNWTRLTCQGPVQVHLMKKWLEDNGYRVFDVRDMTNTIEYVEKAELIKQRLDAADIPLQVTPKAKLAAVLDAEAIIEDIDYEKYWEQAPWTKECDAATAYTKTVELI